MIGWGDYLSKMEDEMKMTRMSKVSGQE